MGAISSCSPIIIMIKKGKPNNYFMKDLNSCKNLKYLKVLFLDFGLIILGFNCFVRLDGIKKKKDR